jgi:hypothetical protein
MPAPAPRQGSRCAIPETPYSPIARLPGRRPPSAVSDRSECPALPRKEERVLTGFELTPTAPLGENQRQRDPGSRRSYRVRAPGPTGPPPPSGRLPHLPSSGHVGVPAQMAPIGAEQPPCRRRCCCRGLLLPDKSGKRCGATNEGCKSRRSLPFRTRPHGRIGLAPVKVAPSGQPSAGPDGPPLTGASSDALSQRGPASAILPSALTPLRTSTSRGIHSTHSVLSDQPAWTSMGAFFVRR